ncbi:MAG: hypothetical protein HY335_04100 [Deinococcus sp.]|nr:hypothetical protein [Deinococcus sp.]
MNYTLSRLLGAVLLVSSLGLVSLPVATIQVDGASRYQTFSGFGATLTAFETEGIYRAHDATQPERVTASRSDREAVARLLYTQLGLTRTRVVLEGFEPVNDNDDPFAFNPAGFDWTVVNPDSDFVGLARPYGLSTWWASFALDSGEREAWRRLPGSACALDPSKIDEEVEWLLAAVLRFRDLGLELPYITVNNEPDLCPPGFKIDIDDFVAIVKRLGTRLRASGLAAQLVVSDGWIPQNAVRYMQAALADPEARQYVRALAYHAYADGYDDPAALLSGPAESNPPHPAVQVRQQIRDLAAQHNLPVWMTEVCYCVPRTVDGHDSSALLYSYFELGRARLNHLHDELTIANVAAFDAMNLFFIERPGVGDELVHVYFRPDGALERYEISTYGYLLGHYSHFIVPGSVRLQADSRDPLVRVVAFARPDGRLVIVALNNNPVAMQAELTFTGLSQAPSALEVLTSQEDALWQSGAEVILNGNLATTILPPLSVTTYLGRLVTASAR